MATLTLYGSAVADATLTTACDMAAVSGGTETSKTTTWTGSSNYGEIVSKGGSIVTVTALPATPTGNGWVYNPGAGTFDLGNWSGSLAVNDAALGPYTIGTNGGQGGVLRFFRYSGGVYT